MTFLRLSSYAYLFGYCASNNLLVAGKLVGKLVRELAEMLVGAVEGRLVRKLEGELDGSLYSECLSYLMKRRVRKHVEL